MLHERNPKLTPTLTRDQSRAIDRRALSEYGLVGLVLMENAARGCVDVLTSHHAPLSPRGRGAGGEGAIKSAVLQEQPVVICCGKGNNGGDGFVMARHLDLRGFDVRIVLCADPSQLEGDAAVNYHVVSQMGLPITVLATDADSPATAGDFTPLFTGAAWIVDALLGTGSRGEPRPPMAALIDAMNAAVAKKFAVDLPSGLDCDTGEPARHTFRADVTGTFVHYKRGFNAATAQPYLGQIHVIDIGVPKQLVAEIVNAPV